ncbi:hypothetical protein E2C01_074102 [Portunus trituberculatus]|uniref:Uncharacterized protein n=1 Tax=Portunus trituberculatus TaxID=210409 RepID=A0A5B7I4Q4_PORTR|nr:hypothetical protein [Portunus trituberculatus]
MAMNTHTIEQVLIAFTTTLWTLVRARLFHVDILRLCIDCGVAKLGVLPPQPASRQQPARGGDASSSLDSLIFDGGLRLQAASGAGRLFVVLCNVNSLFTSGENIC